MSALVIVLLLMSVVVAAAMAALVQWSYAETHGAAMREWRARWHR